MSFPVVTTVQAFSFQTNAVPEIVRRSANFHPSVWGDYFLKYASEEVDKDTAEQAQRLREEVKKMLTTTTINSYEKIQLIDAIQRLGVSYHFEREISEILGRMKKIIIDIGVQNDDLYAISLKFRLLRQEGYNISSDVFKKFTNKEGKFKDELTNDVQGMLSLYEAAHLMVQGEPILEEALSFTTIHLRSLISVSSNLSVFLDAQVRHALKQPLRRGIPRIEARHFISIYNDDPLHNDVLLKFAKLDFNIVQKLHQKEVSYSTRWWKGLEVESKLPYVRDRLVEGYVWIIGVYFEPKYELARSLLLKMLGIVSILDDTYDAYGTLEELRVFTDAVDRWDINCLDTLPEYMKHCYKALLDVYGELDELMDKEGRGPYRAQCAKDLMIQLIHAYMKEAEWLKRNYVPTVEEYMQLAMVTCGYCMLSITSFLGMGDIATEEAFECISKYPKIVRAASVICRRLMDDIVGHKFEQKRGHIASSVECYMKQYGTSEQEAYIELRKQIEESWKDINEELIERKVIPMPLLTRVLNFTRVMDTLYKDQDNYTHSQGLMKDLIKSLFVNPIPV